MLSGNEGDSELYISLDLLIQWNLVPKGFPNITLNEYFNQLMTINISVKNILVFTANKLKSLKPKAQITKVITNMKYQSPPKPVKN